MEIVEKARWVARECLEPRAAGYDASASHPWESWQDLWEQGLLAIAVPREYGGLGLDMLTYVKVIDSLAYGCTSSAIDKYRPSAARRSFGTKRSWRETGQTPGPIQFVARRGTPKAVATKAGPDSLARKKRQAAQQ